MDRGFPFVTPSLIRVISGFSLGRRMINCDEYLYQFKANLAPAAHQRCTVQSITIRINPMNPLQVPSSMVQSVSCS